MAGELKIQKCPRVFSPLLSQYVYQYFFPLDAWCHPSTCRTWAAPHKHPTYHPSSEANTVGKYTRDTMQVPYLQKYLSESADSRTNGKLIEYPEHLS
jgi:hypothetical protein